MVWLYARFATGLKKKLATLYVGNFVSLQNCNLLINSYQLKNIGMDDKYRPERDRRSQSLNEPLVKCSHR